MVKGIGRDVKTERRARGRVGFEGRSDRNRCEVRSIHEVRVTRNQETMSGSRFDGW